MTSWPCDELTGTQNNSDTFLWPTVYMPNKTSTKTTATTRLHRQTEWKNEEQALIWTEVQIY